MRMPHLPRTATARRGAEDEYLHRIKEASLQDSCMRKWVIYRHACFLLLCGLGSASTFPDGEYILHVEAFASTPGTVTAGIQEAINACPSQSCHVVLPQGTFNITSTIASSKS